MPLLEGHFKSFEATSKKNFKATSIFFQKLVDFGHKNNLFHKLNYNCILTLNEVR